MRESFSRRMEEGLAKLAARCEKFKCAPEKIGESLGRLRERNSRASRFYHAKVHDEKGRARLAWRVEAERKDRASPLDGCLIFQRIITLIGELGPLRFVSARTLSLNRSTDLGWIPKPSDPRMR